MKPKPSPAPPLLTETEYGKLAHLAWQLNLTQARGTQLLRWATRIRKQARVLDDVLTGRKTVFMCHDGTVIAKDT